MNPVVIDKFRCENEGGRRVVERYRDAGVLDVRIVHGKGRGSGQRGPVLKQKVNRWLRQWDTVLAFVSTRQVHGGTGALYVLLRQT